MKKLVNLCCVTALLTISTGCAKPVLEKSYVHEPPPPLAYVDKRLEEERARNEALRIAQQKELERMAEQREREEKQRRLAAQENQQIDAIRQTRHSIDDFRVLIESGKCSAAEQNALRLMETVRSHGKRLESDLMTAICLCYLEKDGDVTRFSQCSEELKKMTADNRYLDRETQLVLSLHPHFENNSTDRQRDPRIDLQLEQGIKNLLKNTTK
jgi:hypothetical protein